MEYFTFGLFKNKIIIKMRLFYRKFFNIVLFFYEYQYLNSDYDNINY